MPFDFPQNKEKLSWKESIKKFYLDVFEPLLSDEWRKEYLMAVGLNPDSIPEHSVADKQKKEAQKEIEAAYKSIDNFQSKVQKGEAKFIRQSDIIQWLTLFKEIKHLYQQIKALIEIIRSEEDPFTVEDYLTFLVDLLTINYIRLNYPDAYAMMKFTGVIVEERVTVGNFINTIGGLRFINELHTEENARQFSDSLFLNLAILYIAVIDNGQVMRYGWDPLPEQLPAQFPQADLLSRRMLSMYFNKVWKIDKDFEDLIETTFDLSIAVLTESQGGPSILLYLDASGEFILRLNTKWTARLHMNLPGGMLRLGEGFGMGGDLDSSITLRIYSGLEEVIPTPLTIFEADSGRLDIGKFLIEAGVSNQGYDMKVVARDCVLDLSDANSDGFLHAILGDGSQINFDLGIGYRDGGWYLVGGAGLSINLHLNKKIPGLYLRNLYLELKSAKEAQQHIVHLESSLSFNVEIGPFLATVERLGLQAQLPLPEGGLKDFDADQLDFAPKWPTGVGFSVDAKCVEGGGFVRFDPDRGEYLGFAELRIRRLFCLDNITLKAIALINTRLPDGQEGYSFLLMISAEFDPIQLAMGFTLNGVGGVLGLHRGLSQDKLQAGVKGGKYDYILFPKDPLPNLPLIITGLNDIMPIEQDHHSFGLLGILGWGTPQFLEIKLGLLFELPSWNFALIGYAKAEILVKKKTLARVRVDFAVLYDPDQALFSLDASLNYSKLLFWKLTGDVALRIRGGNDPFFLLSAGGFHKDFKPPEGLRLPKMNRIKIAMAKGNPRLTAKLFFAFTPNTIQLGVDAEASYKKWGIGFEAKLGFAALLKVDPFYFKAEVWGGVYLIFFGKSFGLDLKGTVEGPKPWTFNLYVTFKIWFWSKTVRVPEIRIGEEDTSKQESIDVAPILVGQLQDARNWQAALPESGASMVSLKSTPDGTVESDKLMRFHPIGDLIINQGQVPLNRKLDRFGHKRPGDYHRFSLEINEAGTSQGHARSFFAPAQYFDMKDEEIFQTKSFEKYDSGVRLGSAQSWTGGSLLEKPSNYEEIIFDVAREVDQKKNKVENEHIYQDLQDNNSVALSDPGRNQWRKKAGRARGFHRQRDRYFVVDSFTMSPVAEMDKAVPQSEARQILAEMVRLQPMQEERLEVVAAYEVVDA